MITFFDELYNKGVIFERNGQWYVTGHSLNIIFGRDVDDLSDMPITAQCLRDMTSDNDDIVHVVNDSLEENSKNHALRILEIYKKALPYKRIEGDY